MMRDDDDEWEVRQERAELRAQQARRVMPEVGPLLDAWDQVPNDIKGELEALGEILARIDDGMEPEQP